MVPLNMTYLHCLQHSLFEHLFNLYCLKFQAGVTQCYNCRAYYGIPNNIYPINKVTDIAYYVDHFERCLKTKVKQQAVQTKNI